MKKVAFCTLGCKVNQYETQAMSELFENRGYTVCPFEEKADVYVINTCSVTGLSDRKSRQMIRRAKRKNPDSVIAVTGCYAQTAPNDVLKIEGVNLVLGTQNRSNIVKLCEEAANSRLSVVSDILHTHKFEEELSVSAYEDRTRAYIKVQEGCSQFCSYCIIPYARGPIRSRSKKSVIAEANRLVDKGFCELVLVGIHIASYGKDLKTTSLSELIREINSIENLKRIRLSSIEPMTLNEDFINAVSPADKLCHHFHISLQSGCDETLQRMNRKYKTADYEHIVKLLRENFDDCAITTDIMVGFPGETDEEFEKSLNFARKIKFADTHIFPYSPRPNTPAAKLKQLDSKIKQARSEKMFEVANKSRKEFLDAHTGKTMEVLFEQKAENGAYEGKTKNYIHIEAKSNTDISGRFLNVKIIGNNGEICFGEIIFN